MPTKEDKAKKVQEVIDNSCGTEHYFAHFTGLKFTDGVKGVADAAGAYWLIDIIGSYQNPDLKRVKFQVWNLKVNPDNSAVVTMREDSDKPILVKQEIHMTDFPLESIDMWLIDSVLILPGEY